MRNTKVVFFGTPYYSVYVLDKLSRYLKKSDSKIVAVVTRPPKPVGRDKFVTYSDVDKWAYDRKIKIIRDPASVVDIEADIGVIASYGKIITKNVIDHFSKGIINVHPSILPLFRGASPVQSAIATGIEETGVSFFMLDSEMDHGPILSKFEESILPDDTTQTLRDRLFERSAEVLPKLMEAYLAGKVTPKAQNHDLATFTTVIKKDDGFVPFENLLAATIGKDTKDKMKVRFIDEFEEEVTPANIYNLYRALNPWPGIWTFVKIGGKKEEKRLKIVKTHLESIEPDNQVTNKPTNHLVIDEVQLEGKNPVSWKQFVEGYKLTF